MTVIAVDLGVLFGWLFRWQLFFLAGSSRNSRSGELGKSFKSCVRLLWN